MTEIERADQNHAIEQTNGAAPAEAGQSALVLWAYEARQAAAVASSLAKTSFVPASLRNKPEDITAAILAGQELGLRPMASLRSMDIIQGTPALRAHAMRGLIQSHGHSVQLVTSTRDLCVMRGRRRGEEDWQEVEWTIGRAAELGLTGKAEWKKQPQTMLIARATGEICRLIAADALYAMPYVAEELDGWSSRPPRQREESSVDVPVTAAELTGEAGPAPATPSTPPPIEQAAEPAPTPEDIALWNEEAGK